MLGSFGHCTGRPSYILLCLPYDRFRRLPLAFAPEAVWEQSGLEVATVAGFLHENALHFLTDEAVEDAAEVADCLGDVGAHALVLPAAFGMHVQRLNRANAA